CSTAAARVAAHAAAPACGTSHATLCRSSPRRRRSGWLSDRVPTLSPTPGAERAINCTHTGDHVGATGGTGGQGLAPVRSPLPDAMLLEEEADTVARVGDRVPLRLLHHLAGGNAPERGQVIKPDLGDAIDDRLGASLHQRHAILPHLWEFF